MNYLTMLNDMKDDHYANLAMDKVANLKACIGYCVDKISSDIEEWEKKEYRLVMQQKEVELYRAEEQLKSTQMYCE